MTRILHVLAPATYGGLERVVECLAVAQRARGHDVHIAALTDPGAPEPPLLSALARGGVRVHPVELRSRAYLSALRQLRRTCEDVAPDIIHTHGYVADVLLSMHGRGAAAPVVSTVHGFTGGDWKNRLYEWMQCRAYRRSAAVLAVSGKLARDLIRRGVPEQRLHVVPNAFPSPSSSPTASGAREELGIPRDAFSIGWVGRVSHEKGLDVLIEALPSLERLPWQLTIIGDGPERPRLERHASELAVAERMHWHGAVPRAYDLLAAFDVLVLSSRTEGTPMILLEAMSLGVPIVATAVGGIPDMISSQEAVIVPPEDPAALAAAITSLQEQPGLASQRAARAGARVRTQFAMDSWLDRHEEVYAIAASLLSRPGA